MALPIKNPLTLAQIFLCEARGELRLGNSWMGRCIIHYIGRKSEFAFRNMEMCMANAIVQLKKRFSFYRRQACGGFFRVMLWRVSQHLRLLISINKMCSRESRRKRMENRFGDFRKSREIDIKRVGKVMICARQRTCSLSLVTRLSYVFRLPVYQGRFCNFIKVFAF